MKKLTSVILAVFLSAGAWAASAHAGELTFVCPSNAGGAMDQNTRFLAPYIQKHYGDTVNVVNMGGSGGWIGWKYLDKGPRDGSMICYANFPNMTNGWIDPNNNTGLGKDSFEYLALYTSDMCVLAANKDEKRFTNMAEFIEYAKSGKEPITTGTANPRSDDAVAGVLLGQALGVELRRVAFNGSAEGLAALYGGHIDTWIGNVSEVVAPLAEKEMIVLCVMDKKRSPLLPDVPCTAELGLDVVFSSSRGIIVPKGTDPAAKKNLIDVFRKAFEDKEQLENAGKFGIEVTPLYGDDFQKWIDEQDAAIRKIFHLLDQ